MIKVRMLVSDVASLRGITMSKLTNSVSKLLNNINKHTAHGAVR